MAHEKSKTPEAISDMEATKWELETLIRELDGHDEDQDISEIPVGELVLKLRENGDATTKAATVERAQKYLADYRGTSTDLDELAEAIIDIIGHGEMTPDDKEIDLFEAIDAAAEFAAASKAAMAKYRDVLNIPADELAKLNKMAQVYLEDLQGGRNSLEQMAQDIIRASKS